MIKVENIQVTGWEPAIRGMRNPMNSWDKSDSLICGYINCPDVIIGDADLSLMQKLFHGGTEHRKFMRMIVVYMDITAPLYWWNEYDTYKVGTVANSSSTMHKIHSRDLTIDDFSHDHLDDCGIDALQCIISNLNRYKDKYKTGGDKADWYNMIQLLPNGYHWHRTVMLNYEVAATIIRQRTGHKLDEWNMFVDVLKELPYLMEIMQ